MLALSVKQPWCGWLCAADPRLRSRHYKRVEQRTWRPPREVMGQFIALHASGTEDEGADEWLMSYGVDAREPELQDLFTLSAVIGVGRVVACHRVRPCRAHAQAVFSAGLTDPQADLMADAVCRNHWGWSLAEVQALRWPVLCGGDRGLWHLKPSVEEEVAAQLEELAATRRSA